MKKLILSLSMALTCLISCQSISAQPNPAITKKHSNADIERMIDAYRGTAHRDIYPVTNLQQQLTKDFPKSKDIEWETGADIYEVEFEIGWTDYKAYYDNEANLLMYTVDIRESELPAVVKNAATSKYVNYKFDDIKKIVKGTDTFYKVEMEKRNSADIKATFRPDGTFIKEVYD